MENKKIMIQTHDDMDGVGCGIVAEIKLGRERVDVKYNGYHNIDDNIIDFINNIENQEKYKFLFITDICPRKEVLEMIDKHSYWKHNTRLLDHHDTSDYANNYSWCRSKTLRLNSSTTKTCGTELLFNELITSNSEMNTKKHLELVKIVEDIRLYDTWEWFDLCKEDALDLSLLFGLVGKNNFHKMICNCINNEKNVYQDENTKMIIELQKEKLEKVISRNLEEFETYEAKDGKKFGVIIEHDFKSLVGNRISAMNPQLDGVMIIDPHIQGGGVSVRCTTDLHLGKYLNEFYNDIERRAGGHAQAGGMGIRKEHVDQFIENILKDRRFK